MIKIPMLALAAFFLWHGSIEANATNPNVPSWSPYSTMSYGPASRVLKRGPAIEGRSAYTLNNPEGPLNDYYKDVGLSDDIDDCNRGCVGVVVDSEIAASSFGLRGS